MKLDYNRSANFRSKALTLVVPPTLAFQCQSLATQLMDYAVHHEDEVPAEISVSSAISELAIFQTLEKVCDIVPSNIEIVTEGYNAPKTCKIIV